MYQGQKPECAPGPTMLGNTLIVGIIVPPTCGILGWKGKDHDTSLQRFKPLELFCGIIIGKELPTMLSKDAKETFLVGSIYIRVSASSISKLATIYTGICDMGFRLYWWE